MIRWQQATSAQYKLQSGRLSWHSARRAPGRFRSGLACCCIGSAEKRFTSSFFTCQNHRHREERRGAEALCFCRPSCNSEHMKFVREKCAGRRRARWGSVWTGQNAGLFTARVPHAFKILCVKPKDFLSKQSPSVWRFFCGSCARFVAR